MSNSSKRATSDTNGSLKNNRQDALKDGTTSSSSFCLNNNCYDIKDRMSLLTSMINHNNQIFSTVIKSHTIFSNSVDELNNLMNSYQEKSDVKIKIEPQTFEIKSSPSTEIIENQLFGMKQYKYFMVLGEKLPEQFYKQRNFDIKIKLIDELGNLIININPIPISLVAYDSSQTPQIILENKKNQPIFKGNCESQIKKGSGVFQKIQFREVTSVYRNRWIYFVIYPKAPSFNYCSKGNQKQKQIQYHDIKPLILSDVVVRSKKK